MKMNVTKAATGKFKWIVSCFFGVTIANGDKPTRSEAWKAARKAKLNYIAQQAALKNKDKGRNKFPPLQFGKGLKT